MNKLPSVCGDRKEETKVVMMMMMMMMMIKLAEQDKQTKVNINVNINDFNVLHSGLLNYGVNTIYY